MMNVVVPLGVVPDNAVALPLQITCSIVVIFQDEVNIAITPQFVAHTFCQFNENVGPRVIGDRVYGVKTQAVEVILLQPIKGVVDDELANHPAARTFIVDAITPGSAVAVSKEIRRVRPNVISVRAEVV